MNKQIILASTSPRRKQLMDLLGISYKVVDSGYEEIVQNGLSHLEQVKFLALGKALATAKKYPKAIIISADTMVLFKDKILGKPKTKTEAIARLKSFSGKSQDIITGVVVVDAASGKKFVTAVQNRIYFKKLSDKIIFTYVNSGEPFDKAGGYGPQGLGFNLIEKMDGDFSNFLGLPMIVVYNAMEKMGLKI